MNKTEARVTYHDTPENRLAILDICAQVTGITRQQILSPCRERRLVLARAIAAKLYRERMRMTLKQIGAILGHPKAPKHHSSVIHMTELLDDLLWTKDDEATSAWTEVNFVLAKVMTQGTRVVVYIPDGDDGELLQYLYKNDYRHEIVG